MLITSEKKPEESGRKDSNLRPPAPKAGALARLRYAPIFRVFQLARCYRSRRWLTIAMPHFSDRLAGVTLPIIDVLIDYQRAKPIKFFVIAEMNDHLPTATG